MAQRIAGLLVKLSADSAELKSDLRAVKAQLRGFGRSANREANRVKYAFNKIRRAAQVVASAFIFTAGVRQLGNLISSMAQAEDRVNLLEARFRQFARAGDSFTRVYNLSKELGVSLDETANGMTRLLVATKELGTAQHVLEQVHKNIVILGRAGGTSTEEMKGAMRQLSQGLASGRLQGEELRSVLENLPLVAIEIAKQMGIGLGKIRQYAKEGKISGQVVVDALSEIEIKMEDLPQTWAMQTENLRTEWDLFLNDLSDSVNEAGLLTALTEAVKWVRFNMLDSFYGRSTDDLMARMAQIKTEQGLLEQKADKANDEWRIKPKIRGAAGQEWMAGMDGTGANTGLRNIQALTEEYRRLNAEVDRRRRLEELSRKAAEARSALGSKAEMSQLIKEIKLIDAGDRIDAMWKRLNKNYKDLADTVKDKLGGAFKQFTDQVQAARTVIGRGINLEQWQAYRRMLKNELIPELESVKDTTDEINIHARRAAENIQDAFADFLFDPFEKGVKGMLEGFLTALRRMIAEIAAANILGDPKKGTGISGFLNSIFGRASGGPVSAGTPYMVGEMGPELFVPSHSGSIVANGAMGGVVVNQNYHIEAGADWGTLQKVLPPLFDRNRETTVAEIRNRINEGNL